MNGAVKPFQELKTGEFFHFLCDGFLSAWFMKYGEDAYSRNGFLFMIADRNQQVFIPNGVGDETSCNDAADSVPVRVR